MDDARDTPPRERFAIALLVVASVSFVVALNLTPVFNSDFWIQLKVGDAIRETGDVPRTYEYTYTEAKDESYVEARWLAGLTWSHLYRINGYDGMIVVKCLLALSVFGLVVLLSQQVHRNPNLAIALGCLLILGINFRSLLRPGFVGFVLVLVNLNCLHAFVRSGKPQWLLGLIPTTLVWTNFHPSFLASFAFPVCFAAGEVGDSLWRWKTGGSRPDWLALRKRVGWLALVGLCMLGATFINPYGFHLLEQLLWVEASDFIRENVWEWQSTFHPRFRREPFFYVFVSTVALVVVSGIAGRRKLRATPTLLVLAFFPLALSGMRHIPWFEIVASYFLVHTLGEAGVLRRWKVPMALVLGAALLVGTAVVVENGNTRGRRPGFRNDAPLKLPVIEFLRESEIEGNVFHSYSYGDQLAYHFHPRIRIAMDTRIYPEKYYREYRSMTGGNPALLVEPEQLRDYLERYDVRTIVTQPVNMQVWGAKGHIPVIQELEFKVVYLDRETIVLSRDWADFVTSVIPAAARSESPRRD